MLRDKPLYARLAAKLFMEHTSRTATTMPAREKIRGPVRLPLKVNSTQFKIMNGGNQPQFTKTVIQKRVPRLVRVNHSNSGLIIAVNQDPKTRPLMTP